MRAPKAEGQGAPELAPEDRFFSYKHYLDGNGELIDPAIMMIIAKAMIRNKPDSYCLSFDLRTTGISAMVHDLLALYLHYGQDPSARIAYGNEGLRAAEEGLDAARLRQDLPQVAPRASTRLRCWESASIEEHALRERREEWRRVRGYLWMGLGGERDSARRMRGSPTHEEVAVTIFFARVLIEPRSNDTGCPCQQRFMRASCLLRRCGGG